MNTTTMQATTTQPKTDAEIFDAAANRALETLAEVAGRIDALILAVARAKAGQIDAVRFSEATDRAALSRSQCERLSNRIDDVVGAWPATVPGERQ